MLRKLFFVFLLGLFLINQNTFGQSVGLNFSLAFPQGDFKDNLKTFGWGGSAEGLLPLHPVVGVGVNVGFYNYGSETRNEPWSYTIPDVTMEVSRSNNIANLHIFMRLSPPMTTFKPYVDLLAGGSYLWTETSVYSQNNNNNEPIASTNNMDDFAWSYGVGAGFMFKVLDMPSEQEGMDSELFIDLKVRHLWGSEAMYLTRGDIEINNSNPVKPIVIYHARKSATDLLTAHLGVIVLF